MKTVVNVTNQSKFFPNSTPSPQMTVIISDSTAKLKGDHSFTYLSPTFSLSMSLINNPNIFCENDDSVTTAACVHAWWMGYPGMGYVCGACGVCVLYCNC